MLYPCYHGDTSNQGVHTSSLLLGSVPGILESLTAGRGEMLDNKHVLATEQQDSHRPPHLGGEGVNVEGMRTLSF